MTHATLKDEKNVKVVVNLQWANTFKSGNTTEILDRAPPPTSKHITPPPHVVI